MNEMTGATGEVVVQTRGEVSATECVYARQKIHSLRKLAPGPVLFARVDLAAHADPARERPAFAKAELDVTTYSPLPTGSRARRSSRSTRATRSSPREAVSSSMR